MDRSFDASDFIESNLLGPRAHDFLKDYDLLESIQWVEWVSLRAATIMKSTEPRLTVPDQWENSCSKLMGDLKLLNLQKVEVEKEKWRPDKKIERLKGRETDMILEVVGLKKRVEDEKIWVDKAEASMTESEKEGQELIQRGQAPIAATEGALKAQISLLLLEFDASQLGAFKIIVDGKIVDPSW
ncbi:hypothetical protein PIB30_093166 [Stylosanthes scabra]|uniref:Uncharacterized protein n=1 Tax=Stylosanthes scabra TaxID=79078 RepID=A0ABU6WTD2_9FABA|nr:hypothetical protein [Stylosanthes scabra]